jgi:3-carboxy-cis,cis-muconate cycloisomerase
VTEDHGLLSPVSAGTRAEVLTSDQAFLAAMSMFEVTLSDGLAEVGGGRWLSFRSDEPDRRRIALDAVAPGNPTLPLVTWLREPMDPDDARWVHPGATSQDAVDSALMMVANKLIVETEEQLLTVARRLARLADDHRATPCVARTLTQQAMPTTLGFRVAGWLAGVHDALRLLRTCRPLPLSLSGAIGTAAAYGAEGPAVADYVARQLSLSVPAIGWHTRRTPVLEVATALTAVGSACGRVCADLLLMAQTEVGEASDGSGGPSSAMAHKANPTRSVLVVSAVRQLPGLLGTVAAQGAEASERPAGAWHAEWQPLRWLLRLAGAAAERTVDVVDGATFDTDAMARNLALLTEAVGQGPEWVAEQTAHVGLWIDRVLAQHEEVVG